MEPASPFDDPDVRAALRQAGVVHRPGMADEMLRQLAPLLAEEGIDLSDPDAEVDPERLQSALDYATERYNMELSTPVGEARARTLGTLREISDALQRGDQAEAARVLDSVMPDETAARPSAAQLIGTSLDLLDDWHSHDPTRRPLRELRLPRWLGQGRSAAPDLLALARKGRARGVLDQLTLRHGGLVLAHGGALLVAASLLWLAEQDGEEGYAQVASRYLGEAPPSGHEPAKPAGRQPAAPGSAFGPAAAAAVSSRTHLHGFRDWLQASPGVAAELVDARVSALGGLFDEVTAAGVDPHHPGNLGEVLDIVDENHPAHQVVTVYELLHDYVHYRMHAAPGDAGWDEAHELISEELFEDDGGPSAAVFAAVQESAALDDGQRRAALADLPLITASRELLDWMGASQPITQTGLPRRADIGTVAAMIGVSAEGTTRRGHIDWAARAEELGGPVGQRQAVQVQSAREIPELTAWWDALEEAGVIERLSTRVRPGLRAESIRAGNELSLEVAEVLISAYVAGILLSPMDASPAVAPFIRPIITLTIDRLLRALAPDTEVELAPEDPLAGMFQDRAREELRRLEVAGLVEFPDADVDADGRPEVGWPVVPMALRASVWTGLMVTGSELDPEEE